MSAQFDHLPFSQRNRMGYQLPIDNVAVQRELVGYFFDNPEARTEEIVLEFRSRYGETVIRQNLRRLEDKRYIKRAKKTEPWRFILGRPIGVLSNTVA
jgi:hypothetical protein